MTAVSTAAVSGAAAVLGIILSRKFGNGVKTDGFFAAYGVYLVLVLVGSTLRIVVLGRFAAARSASRLNGELATWALSLVLPLALCVAVALVAPHLLAGALTATDAARDQAAALLPWVVPAAAAQIYAGLAASALAALDDYDWAAAGFALGAVSGVAVVIAFVDHGVTAFGWGLAVNALVALGIPLIGLARGRALGRPDARPWGRLIELLEAVSIPVALLCLYLIGLRFASGLGPGRGTTFSYAYLIAATVVGVTAGASALVTTVPFAREAVSPERVARHVLAISWISLVFVAALTGLFALAGESVVQTVLGDSYAGATGTQLSRLVIYLGPWMVATVAFTIAYPLVFVRMRLRWLPVVAALAIASHVGVEWAARAAFGLAGVAIGLAITTSAVVAVLLAALGALRPVGIGLAGAAATCGALAAIAFLVPSAFARPVAASAVGLVLYAGALLVWRPVGLRRSWAYLRALG